MVAERRTSRSCVKCIKNAKRETFEKLAVRTFHYKPSATRETYFTTGKNSGKGDEG